MHKPEEEEPSPASRESPPLVMQAAVPEGGGDQQVTDIVREMTEETDGERGENITRPNLQDEKRERPDRRHSSVTEMEPSCDGSGQSLARATSQALDQGLYSSLLLATAESGGRPKAVRENGPSDTPSAAPNVQGKPFTVAIATLNSGLRRRNKTTATGSGGGDFASGKQPAAPANLGETFVANL